MLASFILKTTCARLSSEKENKIIDIICIIKVHLYSPVSLVTSSVFRKGHFKSTENHPVTNVNNLTQLCGICNTDCFVIGIFLYENEMHVSDG